ncbi:MAG: hypothetical protein OEN56_07285 [Gemmatimonadota bacterium]|nr:hypothetical protein [Gemmatimonadota bacterium]
MTRGVTELLDELGSRRGDADPAGEANAVRDDGVSERDFREAGVAPARRARLRLGCTLGKS